MQETGCGSVCLAEQPTPRPLRNSLHKSRTSRQDGISVEKSLMGGRRGRDVKGVAEELGILMLL
jgi:hypothetical protein